MNENNIDAPADPFGLANLGDLSAIFARYWLSLPKTDLIPRKRDFRPEHIPEILPCMVIHELIRPDFIKLRLAGTSVVESYDQEITGKNYLDFVEEARRPKASEATFLVCEHPAGMVVQLQSTTKSGMLLSRESIAFPMRDDDGEPRFVYFCSSPAAERKFTGQQRDELQVMTVMNRSYIDIGAGVPDFSD